MQKAWVEWWLVVVYWENTALVIVSAQCFKYNVTMQLCPAA